MKRTLGILSLAFIASVAPALADDTAQPVPPAPPSASQRAAFEQVHAQIKQLRQQERAQILGSLSPAHRATLANVIGQLAIAPNPDPAAAARSIDAALSQNEGNAVLRIHQTFRTQEKTVMDNARTQFESTLTPDQRAQMEARHNAMSQRAGQSPVERQAEDPGHILLKMTLAAFAPPHGHGPGAFGGPGGPEGIH